ncbi:kinase-like protein [Calocera cornea HHB12733]|uniref:Kinase-like protein n=1 Tax=Calocera cornea HHB12733 TaxID=1353952 RepID=A0A165EI48_9BASI|nr:kinase-like protein [Calocera cornea HHB12733]
MSIVLPVTDDGARRRIKHLVRELNGWTRVKHPNIVELRGVCEHGMHGLAMIMPWMQDGDLNTFLLKSPNIRRAPLVRNIALGLDYLHTLNPPIVHGDVRAANVLVDSSGQARLADFGLSRVFLEVEATDSSGSSAQQGNVRWMAPERIFPEEFQLTAVTSMTPASDMYSFGMVIYEIYTGRIPFYQERNIWTIPGSVKSGKRPLHPGISVADLTGLGDDMWEIAQGCWKPDRFLRPTARQVIGRAITLDDLSRAEG